MTCGVAVGVPAACCFLRVCRASSPCGPQRTHT